ncbi:hypothetical protein ABPG75_000995 [Micractinium tetrahymenae]
MVGTRSRVSLQQGLPLHTALLHASEPSSVCLDPALLTVENVNKHVDGFTALHAAALANNPRAIAALTAAAPELAGATLQATIPLQRSYNHQRSPAECQLGATALEVAVACHHAEAAAALLAASAPMPRALQQLLWLCIDDRLTDWACGWVSPNSGMSGIVAALLRHGADCTQLSEPNLFDGRFASSEAHFFPPRSPLTAAVRRGKSAVAAPMMRHLLQQRRQANAAPGAGQPPPPPPPLPPPQQQQQLLTHSHAIAAAIGATWEGDIAAALLFLAQAGPTPEADQPTPEQLDLFGDPNLSVPNLVQEATIHGRAEVVAAALPMLSATQRDKVMNNADAQCWRLPPVAAAASRGHAAVLVLLESEGYELTLAARKAAMEEAVKQVCPAGVRLVATAGSGPAELVQYCQQAAAAAAAQEAADAAAEAARHGRPIREPFMITASQQPFCSLLTYGPRDAPWLRNRQAEALPRVVEVAEALHAAGFRPSAFLKEKLHQLPEKSQAVALALDPPEGGWSPASHHRYPPRFKAAARALLLAAAALAPGTARQQQRGGGTAGASLGSLSTDALLHVMSKAAYPLAAWV